MLFYLVMCIETVQGVEEQQPTLVNPMCIFNNFMLKCVFRKAGELC